MPTHEPIDISNAIHVWVTRKLPGVIITVVELIGNTTTQTGLKVKVIVDNDKYQIGKKVSKENFTAINIEKNDFHGEWNYVIKPQDR